ncbi:unnamed protein product [Trypanosoma congolense IL3000]|uniref:DNA topoisomerase (ATP-hydrolyzing) n=1 Tax=Trypanosoma congolense (strain IL3000) TaxID=1068625 RepID=F9WBV7_TRYCI|nr:unnamed protein product [Trypanosoma congolense IL3000]
MGMAPDTSETCFTTDEAAAPSASSVAVRDGLPCGTWQTHPFIDESTVAANTPMALKEEIIRRMEVFVLTAIHEIVASTKGKQGRDNKRTAKPRVTPAVHGGGGEPPYDEGHCRCPNTCSAGRCTTSKRTHQSRLWTTRQQLLVLRQLYTNTHNGIICTQRDVYYQLSRFFPDQGCVNRIIQQLVQQLAMPRQLLGVVPGTRGCVGGLLSFQGVDLQRYSSEGFPLPTLQEELCVSWSGAQYRESEDVGSSNGFKGFELHNSVRYILVVEKHSVFFRLMEERVFERVPCVLLTSQGFPTASALSLLMNMQEMISAVGANVPLVALVDFNPSGLLILQQYKHNTGRMHESRCSAAHSLRWLGLRCRHILSAGSAEDNNYPLPVKTVAGAPSLSTPERVVRLSSQPFTGRDDAVISNIIARWKSTWRGCSDGEEACRTWLREAQKMQQLRIKVDIEALYERGTSRLGGHKFTGSSSQSLFRGDFSAWVCRGLFRRDYI